MIEGRLGGRAALEIAIPGLEIGRALGALYDRVETVPFPMKRTSGPTWELSFPDGSFDLVTLYGRSASLSFLAEIHRVLGKSGCLFIGVPNRWWYGRLRTVWVSEGRVPVAGPGLAKKVRTAGFAEVRSYLVGPSLAKPREVVPARKAALQVFRRIQRSTGAGRTLRAGIASRLNCIDLLFPARMFVAIA
jgi:SAM-dependent methyltransferase